MPAILVLESPQLLAVAIACGVVLGAAVLWLYARQVHSSGPAGWGSVVLRVAAVAALVFTVLKPVILTPKTTEQWGAVVILIDRSRSMGVVDSGRTPAQLVALGAALVRFPQGMRPDAAERLVGDLDRLQSRLQDVTSAQSDLEYARISGRGFSDRQAKLRQASARYAETAGPVLAQEPQFVRAPQLQKALRELRALPEPNARDPWANASRLLQQARDAAEKDQAASDEQLYRSNAQVRHACGDLARRSRLQLAQEAILDPPGPPASNPAGGLVSRLQSSMPVIGMAFDGAVTPIELISNGKPLRDLQLTAASGQSDLSAAPASAIAALAGRPVRAVVLFSDGRQVGGRGDLTSGLRPSGVPVFTVGLAPAQVPDASIWNVSLPQTAFAGENIEAEVQVRRFGGIKSPQEVRVTSGGQQVVGRLRPYGEEKTRESAASLTLKATPDEPQSVTQHVVFSLPPTPGEVTTENNSVERWIKVSSEKVRVAVCTAAPSWDFQYLRGTLSRAAWVQLESQVLDPDHPKLGLSPAQILDHDVLVLSDLPARALDFNQWSAVDRLVRQRGGSVILIPGTAYQIAEYLDQPTAATLLLPFSDVRPAWKEWPGEQPAFHFVPTALGERTVLGLGEPHHPAARVWEELPGLFRYLQIPDRSLRQGVQKLLLESDSGSAVLTEQRQGAGRVLFLGLNETWRWRLKTGEEDADRFWRQLVRYVAGEPYASSRGPLALDVSRVAIEPGDPLHVRARVRGARFPAETARNCEVEVLGAGKVIGRRQLERVGVGQFAGELRDLPEGNCVLQLRGVDAGGGNVAVRVPVHVASSLEAEMRNVSGDPDRLAKIARASGGQYLPVEQVDRLADRLAALRESESRFLRRPLWNSPYLFAFVFACLCGEWALRKRAGLA